LEAVKLPDYTINQKVPQKARKGIPGHWSENAQVF
jgi:hypothetical protein